MEKEYVDELYHQLRSVYLTGNIQEKEAIMGITSHLTQPNSSRGDYTGLLRFLTWYGEKFLLREIYDAITKSNLKYERIVDLGAGFGWLGRGLAHLSGNLPVLFVDKRQWPLIDIVADIESRNGLRRVVDELKTGDLIVMGELLHCLDYPAGVLHPFTAYPVVAVEYYPVGDDPEKTTNYTVSYNDQIAKFDCKPVLDFKSVFPRSHVTEFHRFPYTIVIARPK